MASIPDATAIVNLQAENQRLINLLEAHNIEWRIHPTPATVTASAPEPAQSNLNTDEKVAVFRRLFRGRTDIYPVRWESQKTGKSGTRQHARMNGGMAYVISHESSVLIAAIAY